MNETKLAHNLQIDQLSDEEIGNAFDLLYQDLSTAYKSPMFPLNPLDSENKEEVPDLLLDSLAAFPLHYLEYQEDQLSPKNIEKMNTLIHDSLSVFYTPRVIGFAGAHRTGKSTLARKVAEKLDYVYLPTNVASDSVWDIFDPHDYFTFAERIEVQERLLNTMESFLYDSLDEKSDNYIIDRTPIDILAYLLSNIDQTASQLYDGRIDHFIKRCHLMMNSYFTDVFVVQPSIPFVKIARKDSKVYNSKAYQLAINSNIIGQLNIFADNFKGQNKFKYHIIPTSKIPLEDRIEFCTQSLRKTYG